MEVIHGGLTLQCKVTRKQNLVKMTGETFLSGMEKPMGGMEAARS